MCERNPRQCLNTNQSFLACRQKNTLVITAKEAAHITMQHTELSFVLYQIYGHAHPLWSGALPLKSSYFPFQISYQSSLNSSEWAKCEKFAANFQQMKIYQRGMQLHDIMKLTACCLGVGLSTLCGPDKRSLYLLLSSNAAFPAWGMSYVRGILASVFKHTEASLSWSNCSMFFFSHFPSPPHL